MGMIKEYYFNEINDLDNFVDEYDFYMYEKSKNEEYYQLLNEYPNGINLNWDNTDLNTENKEIPF